MNCDKNINPKDVIIPDRTFAFLRDPCGKPLKDANLLDVIIGLDRLLKDAFSKLADCCPVTKHFNVCVDQKIRLISLRRGTTIVASNLLFEDETLLLAYLLQYDNFTMNAGVISVTSIFDWAIHVQCYDANCDLTVSIIPPNYSSCDVESGI